MASLNKVQIIGNLGRDPEIKTIPSGQKVASFSLACTEKYTKDGQKVEKTEWVNCKAWGKLAEIIEKYVKKGNQIYVEGKLETQTFEKDGVKRYKTEIVVQNMLMLGGKNEGSNEAPSEYSQPSQNYNPMTDEDLLF